MGLRVGGFGFRVWGSGNLGSPVTISYMYNPSICLINTPIFKEFFSAGSPPEDYLPLGWISYGANPPHLKKLFWGVQTSVGRLLVLLAEMRSYSTSGICSLLFF